MLELVDQLVGILIKPDLVPYEHVHERPEALPTIVCQCGVGFHIRATVRVRGLNPADDPSIEHYHLLEDRRDGFLASLVAAANDPEVVAAHQADHADEQSR